MFSGIIESAARVTSLVRRDSNLDITLSCSFTDQLHIDQSVAHNGVCLTVVALDTLAGWYTVTAIAETLSRSNLGALALGDLVNVERSMRIDGMLDGHIVQGHVDTTARCVEVVDQGGSWMYTFEYSELDGGVASGQGVDRGYYTVEKGSVTVNGVSLTVVNSRASRFSVAIIPYTYEHTNFHCFEVGSMVNLEFDIIGKYIARYMAIQNGGK